MRSSAEGWPRLTCADSAPPVGPRLPPSAQRGWLDRTHALGARRGAPLDQHPLVLAAAMDAFLKRQAEPNAHLWGMQAKQADPTSRECKSHDERVTCVSSR